MITGNSRSWIPFVLLLILVGFVVVYVFFGDILFSGTRQPVQPSPGCIPIQENGNSEQAIDIVFLPDNFEDVSKFRDKTDKMINAFSNLEPYSENKDKFNFYRIEKFDLDLKCDYSYGGDAIVCDPTAVKSSATLCPHDYVIVAVDTQGIQKLFDLLRSSAWMGIASLNSADDPLVFSHEFAHIFADFADEYEYGGKITWDAPNCDSGWETCPKFKVVSDSECVRGCVNNENSRSINVGIMRDYWKSKLYGSYNEYVLQSRIEKSTRSSNSQISKSMPINIVKLIYKNGKWEILEVVESEGYPDGVNTGYVSDYSIVIEGENYENLFELDLPLPILYFDGHDNNSEPWYNTTIVDGASYSVALPKLESETRISLKQNNLVIDAYNFGENEQLSTFNTISVGIPQTFSSS